MMRMLLAVLSVAPMLLVWGLLSLMGRSRRGVVFGVTLPASETSSPDVLAAMARYRDRVLVLGLPFLGLMAAGAAWGGWFELASVAVVPILLIVALLFWLQEHRRLRPLVPQVPTERSASLGTGSSQGLGLVLTLIAALVPLAGEAFWLHGHWGDLPARWPVHWNAAGQVDRWSTPSVGGVYGPLLTSALVLLLLIATLVMLLYASGPGRAERQRALAPLVLLGWLLTIMFLAVGLLPATAKWGEPWMLGTMLLPVLATLGAVAWLLVRMFRTTASSGAPAHDGTPDSMWHAGIFYYNPADAALLVPRRFGWGWTLNYARPLAWVFLALLLVAVAAGPLLMHFLR